MPTGPPARAAVQVAVLVSRLRSVLGAGRLVRSDAGYTLLADCLDLDALATLAEEASRRLAAGSWGAARVAVAAASAPGGSTPRRPGGSGGGGAR